MHAIVLSFDRHAAFVELLYKKYMVLWDQCPLNFRVPFNDANSNRSYNFLKNKDNVELIQTPGDIRSTMINLLLGVDDEEWVYWCIDDRYPLELDAESVHGVYTYIGTEPEPELNAIRLFRWREPITTGGLTISNTRFYPVSPYGIYGFWHHHFVKAKILKKAFLTNDLAAKYLIDDINFRFHHPTEWCELVENTMVPERAMIKLAEPCIDGRLTTNAIRDMKETDCDLPPIDPIDKTKEFYQRTD